MVLLNEYIKRSIFTKLIQQIKRLKNSQKLPVTKKKKNEKVTKLKWICYLLPLSRLTDLSLQNMMNKDLETSSSLSAKIATNWQHCS